MLTISNGEREIDLNDVIRQATDRFIAEKSGYMNGIFETFDPSVVSQAIGEAIMDFLLSLDAEALSICNRSPLSWELHKRLDKLQSFETGDVIEVDFANEELAA